MLWAVLMVSLFGTVVTAPILPFPWNVLVVIPSLVGGMCASLAALFQWFVACAALMDAARLKSTHRRCSSQPGTVDS
jgi:hypothetical protein